MRITKDMVDLMHYMDIHAYMCTSLHELKGVYRMAKRRLINIDITDSLTSEEYHSVLDFIVYVYKREVYRLKYE